VALALAAPDETRKGAQQKKKREESPFLIYSIANNIAAAAQQNMRDYCTAIVQSGGTVMRFC
jgi:hypothetical protein